MGFTKTLFIPGLGISTVTAAIDRAVLKIVVSLVVAFYETVSTYAGAAAFHAVKTSEGGAVVFFWHYLWADRTLAGVGYGIGPFKQVDFSDVFMFKQFRCEFSCSFWHFSCDFGDDLFEFYFFCELFGGAIVPVD